MRNMKLIGGAVVALAAAACVGEPTLAPVDSGAAVVTGAPFAMLESQAAPTTFVVVTNGKWSATVVADLTALGAQVTATFPAPGLAFATSSDPAFVEKARRIAGVQDVAADFEVEWTPPMGDVQMDEVEAAAGAPDVAPAAFGGAETFRAVQWAPDAVHAVEAWDAGFRGAGARVAILDGGIHSTHIDIAPRLDVPNSRSFVPNQPFNVDMRRNAQGQCVLTDTFWHGTHVAGIVAAPGNNIGTVGIAPDATVIGVKVLHCGSGSFAQVIQGIMYAATPIAEGGAGADIINMSLGALILHRSPPGDTIPPKPASGIAALTRAIGLAIQYADSRGVLVVASAGNDATDLKGSFMNLPSDARHALAISATGPIGFALGSTDLDRPASYTNFGNGSISLAGPGGDFVLPGNAVCTMPRFPTGTVVQFCWALDMVMAPCRGGATSISSYCWAAGTSMAAPAVSGVAALIIGKYGKMSPRELRRRLEQSADDLGKPGNDEFYGRGRINALRAVQ